MSPSNEGRALPWGVAATAAIVCLALSTDLYAQDAPSITLPTAGFVFDRGPLPARRSEFKPNWINRADCLANETLTFPLTLANYSGYVLEAWVGSSSCGSEATPAGANPSCWLVYRSPVSSLDNGFLRVPVRARDLIGAQVQTGLPRQVPVAPASVCDTALGPPQSLVIDFMLVDGTTIKSQIAEWTDLGFDVTPPDPPTDVTAGVGDTRMPLAWATSDSNDVDQYDFYCQATNTTPTATYFDAAPSDPGVADTAPSDAGPADAAATDARAPDGGGSAGTPKPASGDAGANVCGPTVLLPGSDPATEDFSSFACGSVNDATAISGTASGLTDGVRYVATISAIDALQNVGPLSDTACATPVELTGFLQAYRQSGGGGLCTVAPATRRSFTPAALFSALLGFGLVRRRGRFDGATLAESRRRRAKVA